MPRSWLEAHAPDDVPRRWPSPGDTGPAPGPSASCAVHDRFGDVVLFDARRASAVRTGRSVMAADVAARPVVGFRHTLCRSRDVLGATGHEDNDSP